ncbi:MAG TPA: hypothetical protein VF317_06200 [Dermatophilaceae bacterium]
MTTTKQFVGDPVDRAYAALIAEDGARMRARGYLVPLEDRAVTHDGKDYITIWAEPGDDPALVLAVYRLLPNGSLKRLKRWPVEVAPLLFAGQGKCPSCDGYTQSSDPVGEWLPCSKCRVAENDAAYAASCAKRQAEWKPTGEPRFWTDDRGRNHPLCVSLTKRGTECKADALPDGTLCLTHRVTIPA